MRRSTALMAAALLLLASSLALAYMSFVAYGERSEEAVTRRMFRDWMAKTNKTYRSTDEEEHRYAVFKENRRRFDRQNAAADAAGVRVRLGLNVFGDLTDVELRSLHTGCALEGAEDRHQNLAGPADNKYALFRWGFPGGRGQAVSSSSR